MNNLINWRKSIPISIQQQSNPFFNIQSALNRAIDDFYSGFDMPKISLERFENLRLNPSIDIVDDKDNFKVEAEMPGMGEDNVKVSINNATLSIKGEKKTSKKDEGKNYLMREISYGSYERHITLPESVDITKAKASFKKGMLWVTIPKKAEAAKQARDIKVEGAAK